MRYCEALEIAEGLASVVVRIARARQAQLTQDDPQTTATLATVAAEVLRLVELRVQVELTPQAS